MTTVQEAISMLPYAPITTLLLEDDDHHWAKVGDDVWSHFSNGVAHATKSTLTHLELPQAAFATNTSIFREDRLVFLLEVLSRRETNDPTIKWIKLMHVKYHSPAALKTIRINFPHLKELDVTNVHAMDMTLPHAFAEVLVETINGLHQLQRLRIGRPMFAEAEQSWTTIARGIFPKEGLFTSIRIPRGVTLPPALREMLAKTSQVNTSLVPVINRGHINDGLNALVECQGSVSLTFLLLRKGYIGRLFDTSNATP